MLVARFAKQNDAASITLKLLRGTTIEIRLQSEECLSFVMLYSMFKVNLHASECT